MTRFHAKVLSVAWLCGVVAISAGAQTSNLCEVCLAPGGNKPAVCQTAKCSAPSPGMSATLPKQDIAEKCQGSRASSLPECGGINQTVDRKILIPPTPRPDDMRMDKGLSGGRQ